MAWHPFVTNTSATFMMSTGWGILRLVFHLWLNKVLASKWTPYIFYIFSHWVRLEKKMGWDTTLLCTHDDIMKWKYFHHCWLFVEGNPLVISGFLSQRTSIMDFWCFFDLIQNKLLNKHSIGQWYETTWCLCLYDINAMIKCWNEVYRVHLLDPVAVMCVTMTLHEHNDISDHWQLDCLLNSFHRLVKNRTPKLCITVPLLGNPLVFSVDGTAIWKVFPYLDAIMGH